MMRRHHHLSEHARRADRPSSDLDDLVLRIRRLIQHRGFDRSQIGSPLLKRLTPERGPAAGAVAEADLRQRLETARLDANAVSYLAQNADAELDLARLRLT